LVLTVWQRLAGLDSLTWAVESAGAADSFGLDRAAAEAAGRTAREGERLADGAGFEAESRAVEAAGAIWRTITATADANDAGVIVLGSRGLTGLRSLLIGSVSNAVMHHTQRPTLLVHQDSKRDDKEEGESGRDAFASAGGS
jgi:nucleotide-binding universal stress UspA family protein